MSYSGYCRFTVNVFFESFWHEPVCFHLNPVLLLAHISYAFARHNWCSMSINMLTSSPWCLPFSPCVHRASGGVHGQPVWGRAELRRRPSAAHPQPLLQPLLQPGGPAGWQCKEQGVWKMCNHGELEEKKKSPTRVKRSACTDCEWWNHVNSQDTAALLWGTELRPNRLFL